MYLEHFGLTTNPFGISPRLDFLYKSGAFEESMAHLVYGLDNSEAIVLITGAIGTGKTMAIQSFLSYLGDRYVSALITNTSVDGKGLLKLILDDLGTPADPRADKSDLLIAFKNFMVAAGRQGQRIVIVIDEAQNLTREVLEEIRLLTNLGQGDEQPVQIILVGQPELEATVQRADLAQLKQRIRVHYKLAPLSRRELEEYVDHRMTVAGGGAGVISNGALDRIFALSDGVPRVVNTLCGEALLSAYVAGRRKVESRDLDDQVEAAAVAPSEPAPPQAMPPATARVADPVPPVPPAPEPAPAARTRPSEMAVRREARAQLDKPSKAHAPAPKAPTTSGRPSLRAVLLSTAAVLVVAVVGMAATGRLQPLLACLPLGRVRDVATERQSAVQTPATAVNRTAALGAEPAALAPAAFPAAPVDTVAAAPPVTSPVPNEPTPSAALPIRAAVVPEARVQAAADWSVPDVAGLADGEYFIHVSSFRTADHASAVAGRFTDGGLIATVRPQSVRDVQWYRVYLGPFASHDDATRLATRLREEGTITYFNVIRLGADGGS